MTFLRKLNQLAYSGTYVFCVFQKLLREIAHYSLLANVQQLVRSSFVVFIRNDYVGNETNNNAV